jgi:pimeloyl-ACP methyl ester carboxylesterase
MDIDLREPVQLGDSTQWIRIRAANARNPLLLLVQMGPGLPMINEVPAFGRALSLEDDFTVVYWDQRGCARSLRPADAARERWAANFGGVRTGHTYNSMARSLLASCSAPLLSPMPPARR